MTQITVAEVVKLLSSLSTIYSMCVFPYAMRYNNRLRYISVDMHMNKLGKKT
jgi:hypothetical protein